jgi:hypothetical protein
MFFTFLNKDQSSYPHISVLLNYDPDELLFYYYNSSIILHWDIYVELINSLADDDNKQESSGLRWLELFENEISAATDLKNLAANEYIQLIGPYYYMPGNVRFYFSKENNDPSRCLTFEDINTMNSLSFMPEMDKELQAYYKSRKNVKKNAKNKEELLKDINMCLKALWEIEHLNKHINYVNKVLEQRCALVEKKEFSIVAPDNLPLKPENSEDSIQNRDNLIPFSFFKNMHNQYAEVKKNFNHERKIYLIKYREYEKACERYKEALENCNGIQQTLMEMCFRDIDIFGSKLKGAQKILEKYNKIILKSFVHADYQDIETLNIFRYYLETGRAQDIQACMNLYEEERHWIDIKASQERIENTIYFLQNENSDSRFADKHINHLLKHVNDKPAALLKI